jgi:hypothetical protein
MKVTTRKSLDWRGCLLRDFYDENGETIAHYTISKDEDPEIEIWSILVRKVDPETDTIGFSKSQLIEIPDRVDAFLRTYLGTELSAKILRFVSKD